ncbi:MAG: fasciclin domain-containing protein [Candidatus Altiarchaeota archaeon]|nr:fasciclin domain-containing protein [Candidatus Altiarchaeota archaeon]
MEKNIVETARSAGSFKKLVEALQRADLTDLLSISKGVSFTVFAPNDKAFAKLPKETLEELLNDKEKLREVLSYHMMVGNLKSFDVAKFKSARTFHGQRVLIDASEGIKVDDATIVEPDIKCSNGIIHVIDSVLMPEKAGKGVQPFPA